MKVPLVDDNGVKSLRVFEDYVIRLPIGPMTIKRSALRCCLTIEMVRVLKN